MINELHFQVQGGNERISFQVKHVFNAGYAGRDQHLVREHIDELAKIGVPSPTTTPTLYPISDYLATTSNAIQVQHGETSGEIEYVLMWANGKMYVTVGSDHTDRNLETFSVPRSKQACPNIIAPEVWEFNDIAKNWDEIELFCWVVKNGGKELYQKAKLSALLAPYEWEETFTKFGVNKDGNIFFSATINTANNNLIFGSRYEIEMVDHMRGRSIKHGYGVNILPKGIE